jgi:hypothetical protein
LSFLGRRYICWVAPAKHGAFRAGLDGPLDAVVGQPGIGESMEMVTELE